jgi:hypothetical protein
MFHGDMTVNGNMFPFGWWRATLRWMNERLTELAIRATCRELMRGGEEVSGRRERNYEKKRTRRNGEWRWIGCAWRFGGCGVDGVMMGARGSSRWSGEARRCVPTRRNATRGGTIRKVDRG